MVWSNTTTSRCGSCAKSIRWVYRMFVGFGHEMRVPCAWQNWWMECWYFVLVVVQDNELDNNGDKFSFNNRPFLQVIRALNHNSHNNTLLTNCCYFGLIFFPSLSSTCSFAWRSRLSKCQVFHLQYGQFRIVPSMCWTISLFQRPTHERFSDWTRNHSKTVVVGLFLCANDYINDFGFIFVVPFVMNRWCQIIH